MKEPDDVFYKIDHLMKKSGKKEKDLINYLGLTPGTYSQWRLGGHGCSYHRHINEICTFFHVTPTELYWGKGEIKTESNGKTYYITDEERSLLELFRKMGPKEQRYVKTMMNVMTE